MSQQSLLTHVVDTLGRLGTAYMITGSIASSIQGEPRSTHDIDLVIELQESAVEALVASFPEPDYDASADAARDAVRRRSMFNVLEVRTGDKVDFWLLTHTPFDRSRFDRRATVELFGRTVFVSTPEDTILQKLSWSQQSGGSERQERDALAVYELQYSRLDQDYLDRWATRLGVADDLARLRDRAEPLEA